MCISLNRDRVLSGKLGRVVTCNSVSHSLSKQRLSYFDDSFTWITSSNEWASVRTGAGTLVLTKIVVPLGYSDWAYWCEPCRGLMFYFVFQKGMNASVEASTQEETSVVLVSVGRLNGRQKEHHKVCSNQHAANRKRSYEYWVPVY